METFKRNQIQFKLKDKPSLWQKGQMDIEKQKKKWEKCKLSFPHIPACTIVGGSCEGVSLYMAVQNGSSVHEKSQQ